MSNFFESSFAKKLQGYGEKFSGNQYLSAITSGLMIAMSTIMVGAICQILSVIPFPDTVKAILTVPYNMTTGILALIAAFSIAFVLAGSLKQKPLSNAIMSAALFLMVAAPAQSVTLENGSSMTVMDTSSLGGIGLFTAIIIALLSVRITKFCKDKNIIIRMPDVVPQFLADSFSNIIPLLINVIIFHGLNTILQYTVNMTLPLAIMYVLAIPLSFLTSTVGIFIVALFALILWIFGIHGTMIIMSLMLPSYMQAVMSNAELVAAGADPVFTPVLMVFQIAAVGGTGCTLGLAILGWRSKSEQIKAVSRAGLVPGLCNINEPISFGMPIVYNPILAIPYVITPVVMMLIYYLGMSVGILKAPHILMVSILPLGVGEFLGTLSWTNVLFPFLMIPVTMLIYYPFFKIYENQLVTKEAALKESA